MSLKTKFREDIAQERCQVVEPLLGDDNVYRLIGPAIEQMLEEAVLAERYDAEGRPVINPIVLTLVRGFQFLEKWPDWLAVERAVKRLDWKYALRQSLAWRGFHYTDLCNFGKRLLKHGQEPVAFEPVVKYLGERGYLKAGGKQRTDSTPILGAVMRLSRLALVNGDAPWTLPVLPASFVTTYRVRQQALRQTGQEGNRRLDHLTLQARSALLALLEIVQLGRVWHAAGRWVHPATSTGR